MSLPKIFVAIDVSDLPSAKKLIQLLDPKLCGIKIGKELFTAVGPHIVEFAVNANFSVFLDLKFHDIPNTVAKACVTAANLGVSMLNVHASGGVPMLCAAREAIDATTLSKKPLLLGVTLLTSLTENDLLQIGFKAESCTQHVLNLAVLAQQTKLDGIVCSPNEVRLLKQRFGSSLKYITPGIRPSTTNDDQKRIATPSEAIQAGSDILVIGRPITQAEDPATALITMSASLNCPKSSASKIPTDLKMQTS